MSNEKKKVENLVNNLKTAKTTREAAVKKVAAQKNSVKIAKEKTAKSKNDAEAICKPFKKIEAKAKAADMEVKAAAAKLAKLQGVPAEEDEELGEGQDLGEEE